MNNLIIIGASGNSLAIINSINRINSNNQRINIVGILDDITRESFLGLDIIGDIKNHSVRNDCFYINGISSIKSFIAKKAIIAQFKKLGAKFLTVIDPTAYISEEVKIGEGSYIGANNYIGSFASIGEHCIFLQNIAFNHHSKVSDFTSISSGVSILGHCSIGNSCFISANSSVNPHIYISNNVVIGTASNVTKDCESDSIYYGNPAKLIKLINPLEYGDSNHYE
jgi:sugar O-acyltransferase (sialic acid O-acetyltransferase NeuD family)